MSDGEDVVDRAIATMENFMLRQIYEMQSALLSHHRPTTGLMLGTLFKMIPTIKVTLNFPTHPNEEYRPLIEKCIGRRYWDWDWKIDRNNLDFIELRVRKGKKSKLAYLLMMNSL